ncbi:MAG TPA: CNNM domain-containing protein [Gemmatimonadaceae bacterium]|nr:CNNM domain-containing protein [Gemmatimonadaceae bacterium]
MTTLGVVFVLALVVAWLTAAATAVRSVSRIWLRHWAELRLSGAGAATLQLERPQRFLLAAGTGIAGTVFAIGAFVGLSEDRQVLVQYLVFTAVLLLIVGQLLPRAIARRWPTLLAPMLMPALRALEWLCTPLLLFAAGLVRRFTRQVSPEHADGPRDALEDLLREGELEGVGEASESAIISGVVDFTEKRAADVMTPRAEIVAAERAMPGDAITRLVAHAKYSRVPVYEHDLDHVVGLVHSFDVLAHPEAPVAHLRKVVTARADTPCHALMRRMLREHVHLAIVQGDAGDTLGLVTLEDLVEELVGDISDEHDEPRAGL